MEEKAKRWGDSRKRPREDDNDVPEKRIYISMQSKRKLNRLARELMLVEQQIHVIILRFICKNKNVMRLSFNKTYSDLMRTSNKLSLVTMNLTEDMPDYTKRSIIKSTIICIIRMMMERKQLYTNAKYELGKIDQARQSDNRIRKYEIHFERILKGVEKICRIWQ
jgi:hypothetical protein